MSEKLAIMKFTGEWSNDVVRNALSGFIHNDINIDKSVMWSTEDEPSPVEAFKNIVNTDSENFIISEKPVIPIIASSWIDYVKTFKYSISYLMTYANIKSYNHELTKWCYETGNNDNLHKLARAWLDGYIVEAPLYYAKIKGHEFIDVEVILDDDTGEDISEMCRNIYLVKQKDGKVVVDMKEHGLSGAKNLMTYSQWKELGIDNSNADFKPMEEQ